MSRCTSKDNLLRNDFFDYLGSTAIFVIDDVDILDLLTSVHTHLALLFSRDGKIGARLAPVL